MRNHNETDGPGSSPQPAAQGTAPGHAPPPTSTGEAHFARRVTVAVLITVLILAVAYFLWRALDILLEAFAGVLVALFLEGLSRWLSKHSGLSYRWALAVVVLGLLGLTAAFGWLLADRLGAQAQELTQKVPESLHKLRADLEEYPLGRTLVDRVPKAAESLAAPGQFTRITGLVSGVSYFLLAVLVIFFVGLFGAAQPDLYREGVLHLVPKTQRRRVTQALDAAVFNLRWWLVAQAVLMVVMGITTWLGLWLLGVPLALTLGLIAGVFEVVPYLGPWLSAVPAALIALLVSPWHVVMVLGLFLVLHLLEGYVLVPLVQQRAIHLPPALTLVAQVLMGELMGLLGLFVAAPLAVTVVVFLKMLYVQDTLSDHAVQVPGGPGDGRQATAPQPGTQPS